LGKRSPSITGVVAGIHMPGMGMEEKGGINFDDNEGQ
jgi:hypothetical protein